MTDTPPAFPPLHVYALARRCSQCGAEPGVPCEAPRKEADFDSRADIRQQTGQPQVKWDAAQLIHARRQDAGRRHQERDEAKAPAPEDREPGRRYDTTRRALAGPAEDRLTDLAAPLGPGLGALPCPFSATAS